MSEGEMEPCSTSVQKLFIRNSCDSIKSPSLRCFPKLCSLHIWRRKNFETLLIPDVLQYLVEIEICICPEMVSFPNGGLPAPNLKSLIVVNCEQLKLLPQQMVIHLPSLQSLKIRDCPKVESFSDGGLPASIRQVEIHNCQELMRCRLEWGLHMLPSLEEFSISGEYEEQVLESFPEEWLLTTALTSLMIEYLPNLKSLNPKGLQRLTSLTRLHILDCPKLLSLPEEGLPISLSFLSIYNCPLLKECYEGKDWSEIAQIRRIILDGEDIINF